MSDLEKEMLCHEALGYKLQDDHWPTWMLPWHPLENNAQAMAIVKKCGLFIEHRRLNVDAKWRVYSERSFEAESMDLNRAIVECVAKMRARAPQLVSSE